MRVGAIERRPELETSERAHFRVEYVVADADGNEARATRDVVVESISDAVRAQLLSGDVVFACSRRALVAAVAGGLIVAAALLLGGASPLGLAAYACSPVLPPDVALALNMSLPFLCGNRSSTTIVTHLPAWMSKSST